MQNYSKAVEAFRDGAAKSYPPSLHLYGEMYSGHLLQGAGRNALEGALGGNSDVFMGQSAIHEMAQETRFSRRLLSERLLAAVEVPNGEYRVHSLPCVCPTGYR